MCLARLWCSLLLVWLLSNLDLEYNQTTIFALCDLTAVLRLNGRMINDNLYSCTSSSSSSLVNSFTHSPNNVFREGIPTQTSSRCCQPLRNNYYAVCAQHFAQKQRKRKVNVLEFMLIKNRNLSRSQHQRNCLLELNIWSKEKNIF